MSREIDIAWAAGLFEGEGSCYIVNSQNRRPTLELSSTDEDVVKRFMTIVGVGKLYTFDRKGHKSGWRWMTGKKSEVVIVLELLMPYLGIRRLAAANELMERTTTMVSRLSKNDKLELLRNAGLV